MAVMTLTIMRQDGGKKAAAVKGTNSAVTTRMRRAMMTSRSRRREGSNKIVSHVNVVRARLGWGLVRERVREVIEWKGVHDREQGRDAGSYGCPVQLQLPPGLRSCVNASACLAPCQVSSLLPHETFEEDAQTLMLSVQDELDACEHVCTHVRTQTLKYIHIRAHTHTYAQTSADSYRAVGTADDNDDVAPARSLSRYQRKEPTDKRRKDKAKVKAKADSRGASEKEDDDDDEAGARGRKKPGGAFGLFDNFLDLVAAPLGKTCGAQMVTLCLSISISLSLSLSPSLARSLSNLFGFDYFDGPTHRSKGQQSSCMFSSSCAFLKCKIRLLLQCRENESTMHNMRNAVTHASGVVINRLRE